MSRIYDGIKYYGTTDSSFENSLYDVEKILIDLTPSAAFSDINKVIELHNVKKCFESGLRLSSWNEETYLSYKKKLSFIPSIIGKHFSQVNERTLMHYYSTVDILYQEDFWEIISDHKVYRRITPEFLSKLLADHSVPLWQILIHKNLSYHFGDVIAEHMRKHPNTASLLIKQYLSSEEHKNLTYYIPRELTSKDKLEILFGYVNSESPNPNNLELLMYAPNTTELPSDNKLRLTAKKRYEQFWENHKTSGVHFQYGVGVSIAPLPGAKKHVQYDYNQNILNIIFNKKLIESHLDYPHLFSNFISLFEFVDTSFRCTFLSIRSTQGLFEIIQGKSPKNYYPTNNTTFDMNTLRTHGIMHEYLHLLKQHGICIEDIFHWFFNVKLKEFGVDGFEYSAPSPKTTIIERCKLLSSAIDSILKQYKLYCEDGYIDRELFEMSSGHIKFSDVPSLQSKKYAYANSKSFREEADFLFSNQSILHYSYKTEAKYDTFAQMINNEDITEENFAHYQIPSVRRLEERGTISRKPDNTYQLNIKRTFILRQLYDTEVICPSYCKKLLPFMDELECNGDLRYASTLFSEPEQNYLNFMLNKSEFTNGYDLRNKYIHGTYPLDETRQEWDYIELLKVMTLIIIKIFEEFFLRESSDSVTK